MHGLIERIREMTGLPAYRVVREGGAEGSVTLASFAEDEEARAWAREKVERDLELLRACECSIGSSMEAWVPDTWRDGTQAWIYDADSCDGNCRPHVLTYRIVDACGAELTWWAEP